MLALTSKPRRAGSASPEGDFPKDVMTTGMCGCAGCRDADLKEHNRQALRQEIALVTRFIEQGQLRELVESRCRMDAPQVAIMRHLDNKYAFMEAQQPIGTKRCDAGKLRRVHAAC